MAKNEIFPAVLKYLNSVCETSSNLNNNGINNVYLLKEIRDLSELIKSMKELSDKLEEKINKARSVKEDFYEASKIWRDEVLLLMNKLRKVVDTLEIKVDRNCWPMPNYVDLLYGI